MANKVYITDQEKLEDLADKFHEHCVYIQNMVPTVLVETAKDLIHRYHQKNLTEAESNKWTKHIEHSNHTPDPIACLYSFLVQDKTMFGEMEGAINQITQDPSLQCDFMEYFLQEFLQDEYTFGAQTMTTVVEDKLKATKLKYSII